MDQTAFIGIILGNKSKCILRVAVCKSVFFLTCPVILLITNPRQCSTDFTDGHYPDCRKYILYSQLLWKSVTSSQKQRLHSEFYLWKKNPPKTNSVICVSQLLKAVCFILPIVKSVFSRRKNIY